MSEFKDYKVMIGDVEVVDWDYDIITILPKKKWVNIEDNIMYVELNNHDKYSFNVSTIDDTVLSSLSAIEASEESPFAMDGNTIKLKDTVLLEIRS